MPLPPVFLMLSLCTLSELETVLCYTYQTEPLFRSFSELAALERNSPERANEPHFYSTTDPTIKTFAVNCREDGVEVAFKVHLFDPGRPVEPEDLRLGTAARHRCTARASGHGDYVIRAALTDCGGTVTVTHNAVVYNNLLLYSPPAPASPGGLMPAGGTAAPIQCEYGRRYAVSSGALKPTWRPLISIQPARLDLDFHLRLMTRDWSSERESKVYFLGETVNMEASVDHHHLPLRLFVDSCVATLTADVNSHPRYPFIDHRGCFTDSQLQGSRSRFLPRVRGQLLQIQLQPLLFHQDQRNTVHITCYLEAEPVSNRDPVKRACSFMGWRWESADGDNHLCESCSSTSGKFNHKRALWRQTELHRETSLGPVIFLP